MSDLAAPLPLGLHNRLIALLADLAAHGFAVAKDFLPAAMVAALREEAAALEEDNLAPAGVGRDDDLTLAPKIRRTQIKWLDGATPPQSAFLDWAETVRLAANARHFLGLFEFEAHYAVYPEGGFYARHLDSFAGARNRIVSLILYLDPQRRMEDGGLLLVYHPDTGAEIARVCPEAGTVVLLLSEEMPHEVTRTARQRHAIAGWFRLNQTTDNKVDPPA